MERLAHGVVEMNSATCWALHCDGSDSKLNKSQHVVLLDVVVVEVGVVVVLFDDWVFVVLCCCFVEVVLVGCDFEIVVGVLDACVVEDVLLLDN